MRDTAAYSHCLVVKKPCKTVINFRISLLLTLSPGSSAQDCKMQYQTLTKCELLTSLCDRRTELRTFQLACPVDHRSNPWGVVSAFS